MSEETPLMQQYLRIKSEHEDKIMLFRMGDFYEMFYDDAKLGARVLGLTLTSRNNGAAGRVPLAGLPVKAAAQYIPKLIEAGLKVAICEQVEDPKKALGVVKREVIEVITPGTAYTESLLDAARNNYIACAWLAEKTTCGLAWADLTTGEFYQRKIELAELADEIRRLQPAELVLEGAGGIPEPPAKNNSHPLYDSLDNDIRGHTHFSWLEDWRFECQGCFQKLTSHFKVSSLKGFGIDEKSPGVVAAGVLLDYIARMQPAGVESITSIQPFYPDELMVLDASTVTNLELLKSFQGGSEGTLAHVLDRTSTSMGARTLRRWIVEPLIDRNKINQRLDCVDALFVGPTLRSRLRDALGDVYDIERLVGRISGKRAGPRDVAALGGSLSLIPEIKSALKDSGSKPLAALGDSLEEFPELVELINTAIEDDPPLLLADGGVIRSGYNAELDDLRSVASSGRGWIVENEAKLRNETGIPNLKIKYNKVFGYFIEVTKSNLKLVPETFIRKQTISTGERYITPELKEYEEKVLGAEEKIASLEYEIFCELREKLAAESDRLQNCARRIAVVDVLCSLAEVAADLNYCRPHITADTAVRIKAGRHPVVEKMLITDTFVPNDLLLDNSENQINILTGPNMAGKSTILRQMGLIVLMAHMGSFVPAQSADICLVDRIFTRVGASDNLVRGQSTFMVEMNETANILNNCTNKSLILLDEIGRGTSTFDGLSIAWAVTEYIHERKDRCAKTIFATHYHELTELESMLPRVKNFNVLVKDYGEKIIFLYKMERGGSDRSYGIQVARLAGIPQAVIDRAKEVLANLERGEFVADNLPSIALGSHAPKARKGREQLNLFDPNEKYLEIVEALRQTDPDSLSPREALDFIYKLKEKA